MANADVQQMTNNNEVESGRSQFARSKMKNDAAALGNFLWFFP